MGLAQEALGSARALFSLSKETVLTFQSGKKPVCSRHPVPLRFRSRGARSPQITTGKMLEIQASEVAAERGGVGDGEFLSKRDERKGRTGALGASKDDFCFLKKCIRVWPA